MNIIDIVIFSVYIVSLLTLLFFLIKNNIDKRKLLSMFIQSEMNRYVVSQRLEEALKELSNKELLESDGFVKFISDSRDWAFQYIEEVQKALDEFDKRISPELEWSKTFGTVLGDNTYTDALNRISEAYDKLKSVLPKNDETPNN